MWSSVPSALADITGGLLLEVVLILEQLRDEAVVRPCGVPLGLHQRRRLGGREAARLHQVSQDEDDLVRSKT